MDLKTQAKIKRIGLLVGLYTIDDIVKWAEKIILDLDDIEEYEIFDIAGGQMMNVNEMSSLLAQLSGGEDSENVLPHLYADLKSKAQNSREGVRLAVSCLANLSSLTSGNEGSLYFKDAFEDADKGVYGNESSLTNELFLFLEKKSQFKNN
ncbi:hypothetical protein ACJJIX_01995 [Microbulbifer sp. VAAC004]|uniref:hypothetical protein n=1 Tax=unclassified Microbulbifer TaxID=2619833 RepID=UPI00403A4C0F